MAALALPCTLTLSTGRVRLRRRRAAEIDGATERRHAADAPLFADAIDVLTNDVAVESVEDGAPLDVEDLPLADFHVLRAVLTKAGFLDEDEVELDCYNCGEVLVTQPCARLELGPWLDDELDDPELDHTLDFGEPLDIAPCDVSLGARRTEAKTVTFAPRTVREAKPLFAALAIDPLEIDAAFVTAMGIRALGPVSDAAVIARALADADDVTFDSVGDAFLASHYPLRLASDVICPKCRAKNTTMAPAVRELELGPEDLSELDLPDDDASPLPRLPPLPPLDQFVELAHAIAEPLIAQIPGEKAVLVVEDGTPAVDDGGVPLLGSYLPPPPRELPVPTQPPTVTIYYRTFQALERDEGPYDWRDELTETIEHELEHHVFFLRGDDPMADEEHRTIEDDAVRIVGRGESQRRAIVGFGQSLRDFWRRGWPLVVIGALVLGISLAEGRCGGP